jgi:hypothetical protein
VYDLVQEGVTWFSWQGASTQTSTVTVTTPAYGVTWGANTLPTSIAANSSTNVTATFTNAGSLNWQSGGANPTRFGYRWYSGACPAAGATAWDTNRATLASNVAPGATVTGLAATINAPASAGTYCLVYDLVREGIAWFSWQGAATQSGTVTVTAPVYGVAWGANTLPSSMAAGSSTDIAATFTNAGSLTWLAGGANPVRFGYRWYSGSCPPAGTTAWDTNRAFLPGNVATGATVTGLALTIYAPASAGTYCLVYDLVREGMTWFSWQGASMQTASVTITTAVYGVSWGSTTTPSTMTVSSSNAISATFTNTGTLTWSAGGSNPVRFAYHWLNGACPGTTVASFDGTRTVLGGDVAQSGTVSALSVTVNAPSSPGVYCLVYDLVREGITWFSWQGASTLATTVTVS